MPTNDVKSPFGYLSHAYLGNLSRERRLASIFILEINGGNFSGFRPVILFPAAPLAHMKNDESKSERTTDSKSN